MVVKHPEDYCHRCLGKNFSWSIDSGTWNEIMRHDDEWKWDEIICPQCFGELVEERFGPQHFTLRVIIQDSGGGHRDLRAANSRPAPGPKSNDSGAP